MSDVIRNDLPWTDEAQFYREFVPRRNMIEVTIFWREKGVKCRLDLDVTEEELNGASDATQYIIDKAYAQYLRGDFTAAGVIPRG